jgi:hypothetical protein
MNIIYSNFESFHKSFIENYDIEKFYDLQHNKKIIFFVKATPDQFKKIPTIIQLKINWRI